MQLPKVRTYFVVARFSLSLSLCSFQLNSLFRTQIQIQTMHELMFFNFNLLQIRVCVCWFVVVVFFNNFWFLYVRERVCLWSFTTKCSSLAFFLLGALFFFLNQTIFSFLLLCCCCCFFFYTVWLQFNSQFPLEMLCAVSFTTTQKAHIKFVILWHLHPSDVQCNRFAKCHSVFIICLLWRIHSSFIWL